MTLLPRSNNRKRGDASSAPVGGFSLVELLVAILLATILLGGGVSLYLGSKRSYTEVEQVASLAENARFSLSVLERNLRHAGFFGAAGPGVITLDGDLGAVTGNCTGAAAAYNLEWHFFGVSATTASPIDCIDDATPNTDVLIVKHLTPAPRYDADPRNAAAARDGVISFPAGLTGTQSYAVVNTGAGILFDGADGGPSVAAGGLYANGVAYPFSVSIFYVRDTGGVPALARKTLRWDGVAGAMSLVTQDLVEGVENLQFLYGLDDNGDGEPDRFVNDTAITTSAAWGNVLVVRAFLLVQSVEEDFAYTSDRSFQLGDINVGAANDNRRRMLMSTYVTLRNPRMRIRGGAG